MVNRSAPIGTIEVLLSPGSYVDPDGATADVEVASMVNISEAFGRWSDRAHKNKNNVAIFYYCGHGLEREGTILLPSDFGNPAINISMNMIDFNGSCRKII